MPAAGVHRLAVSGFSSAAMRASSSPVSMAFRRVSMTDMKLWPSDGESSLLPIAAMMARHFTSTGRPSSLDTA